MGFFRRALALAVAATGVVSAWCHGMMAEPAARNVVHNSNNCPHCLAAGGPGVTFADGRKWPNSLHGVCGDPHAGPLDHEAGGKFASKKITGVYAPGQTIAIRIKITAPHGGRFSFGLCPVPDGASDAQERATVTQRCLDSNPLINAADGTKYWWLGQKGSGEYTMQFRLPAALVCKRCVLQWHYESGNSCTIPGTPKQHVLSPNMVPCDQTSVMEEFWNCADVSIQAGARVAQAAQAVQAVPVAPAAKVPGRVRGLLRRFRREGFGAGPEGTPGVDWALAAAMGMAYLGGSMIFKG